MNIDSKAKGEMAMLVNTKYGQLQGVCENNMDCFKGVPYAKAPVGELRFKKPVDVEPWEGIRDASTFGKKSIQRTQEKGSFYQVEFYNDDRFEVECSEDCLYLNIYTPVGAAVGDKKYPVAIYVHGGAFMGGAGSNLPFVPTKLVEEGTIIVTINYRLGIWGFMYHEGLCPGNLGLWDQAKAMTWVRENIAAFGGDDKNITVFGQSAGAMSLQMLAVSSIKDGLFDKMILQSGGGYKNPLLQDKTIADAEEAANWVLEALNGQDPMTADADAVQMAGGVATGKSFQAGKMFAFVPIIDGELITEGAVELMNQGKFADIPYILGANQNDLTTENIENVTQETNPMQGCNVEYAIRANEVAQKNGSSNESFVYYFSHPLPGDDAAAFHSAELWYVFGSLDYCWRPMTKGDYELSDRMVKAWANFMKTGKPGDGWDACTRENPFVKEF